MRKIRGRKSISYAIDNINMSVIRNTRENTVPSIRDRLMSRLMLSVIDSTKFKHLIRDNTINEADRDYTT